MRAYYSINDNNNNNFIWVSKYLATQLMEDTKYKIKISKKIKEINKQTMAKIFYNMLYNHLTPLNPRIAIIGLWLDSLHARKNVD